MGLEHHARPYAFDRVFAQSARNGLRDQPDLVVQLDAIRADRDRRQGDAEAAVARARADGFAAGLAQARAEIATSLLSAETALADGLDRLEARFAETEARIAGVAAEVAMAAAELLAARAIAECPALAIDAAVGRVLSQTGFRETLHLHVHPSTGGQIRALLADRESAEQRPLAITVHDDPALAAGDANILWDQGGLSLDAAARNAAVRAALGLGADPA